MTRGPSETKGWYKPKMDLYNLEAYGQPDQEFEAIQVNSLPYGDMEDMLALRGKMEKDPEEAKTFMKQMVTKLFVGKWTIKDPKSGEPLPSPAEDPTSYKRIPTEVLMHMISLIMPAAEEADVPQASGSRP